MIGKLLKTTTLRTALTHEIYTMENEKALHWKIEVALKKTTIFENISSL